LLASIDELIGATISSELGASPEECSKRFKYLVLKEVEEDEFGEGGGQSAEPPKPANPPSSTSPSPSSQQQRSIAASQTLLPVAPLRLSGDTAPRRRLSSEEKNKITFEELVVPSHHCCAVCGRLLSSYLIYF